MVEKKVVKKSLARTLKKVRQKGSRTEPLWKGPEVDGVTQSMLNAFLFCRERFRVQYILGWTTPDEFNANIEYGNMWHLCEEHADKPWLAELKKYALGLCKKYPLQQEQVSKWYQLCLRQFPVYVEFWQKHKERRKQETLFTEVSFEVPYALPSGRTVLLRGKWDEGLLEGPQKKRELWLKENKTKGTIDEETIKRQLTFDLQTMMYLVALHTHMALYRKFPLSETEQWKQPTGVIYNVVRRPLSGGKGTIRQLENASKGRKNAAGKPLPARPEKLDEYYDRAARYWIDEPEAYFFRWKVEVTEDEVEKFKRQFLTPILEQMCDWYEIVVLKSCLSKLAGDFHWRTPFGVWNPLARGLSTEYDVFLETGNAAGLVQNDRLFEELD